MLCLYLARHGQDEDNARVILNGRRNMPLTEKGVEQAREVAKKIRETRLQFDAVYTSPLQRARRTAEIISSEVGAPSPIVLPDLIERDFGVMSGEPQNSIEERCAPAIVKTETVTYFLEPEGAETFPQLMKRAERLLDTVGATNSSGNILLVTHGDIGKMLYAAYYHLDWMSVLTMFHFGNSELLELSEQSAAEDSHVFKIQQHNL